MKRLFSYLGIGLLIILYQNCGDGFRPLEYEDELIESVSQDPVGPDEVTPPAEPTVAERASLIFENKCNSCHGPNSAALAGIDYVSNMDLMAVSPFVVGSFPERSTLMQHLESATMVTPIRSPMPPDLAQALTADELQTIRDWINTVPRPQVVSASFQVDVMPIIEAQCIACHDMGAVNGVSLNDYTNVVLQVTAGDATTSPLSLSVMGMGGLNGDAIMPPAPAAPLNQTQINLINRWINEGAQNN